MIPSQNRAGAVIVSALLILTGVIPARAQFTPQEIDQRAFWERFLSEAEIIRSEAIGEGVTEPYALYLKSGETEHKAAWKNPSGVQSGFLEGWRYEIAAYRLDKLVGLDMIPPTVEREFKGKRGALSLWAPTVTSLLHVEEQKIEFPAEARPGTRQEEVPHARLGLPHRERGQDPAKHSLHQGLAHHSDRSLAGLSFHPRVHRTADVRKKRD